jgi:hypothetical protein
MNFQKSCPVIERRSQHTSPWNGKKNSKTEICQKCTLFCGKTVAQRFKVCDWMTLSEEHQPVLLITFSGLNYLLNTWFQQKVCASGDWPWPYGRDRWENHIREVYILRNRYSSLNDLDWENINSYYRALYDPIKQKIVAQTDR